MAFSHCAPLPQASSAATHSSWNALCSLCVQNRAASALTSLRSSSTMAA